jgi:hypothetical protein
MGIIEFPSPNGPNPVQHFIFAIGKMLTQPLLEERPDAMGQSTDIAG